MEIVGQVCAGLGRAGIFMAQPHFQDQFKKLFDQTAWPGTLNVQVTQHDLVQYIALRNHAGMALNDEHEELNEKANLIDTSSFTSIRIKGFLRDGVSFGGATAFRAKISSPSGSAVCALLIPDLTRHVDVIEIIAPLFLRESLDVKDEDSVTITLHDER